jgi:hypothetical protein
MITQEEHSVQVTGTGEGYIEPGPVTSPRRFLDFSAALQLIKMGMRAARTGWNGKDMHIAAQWPDEKSMMRRPYLYMSPANGELVPWVASQADLFANDWECFP